MVVKTKVNKQDLFMCLTCKKLFSKIHDHHISYRYNLTVPVCEKCHQVIHRTFRYPGLKPIDYRDGSLRTDCVFAIVNNDDPFRPMIRCGMCGRRWHSSLVAKRPVCPGCGFKAYVIRDFGG